MTRFPKYTNTTINMTLLVILLIAGCHGIAPVAVRYIPSELDQHNSIGTSEIKLDVKDVREKKVFFRSLLEGQFFKKAQIGSHDEIRGEAPVRKIFKNKTRIWFQLL